MSFPYKARLAVVAVAATAVSALVAAPSFAVVGAQGTAFHQTAKAGVAVPGVSPTPPATVQINPATLAVNTGDTVGVTVSGGTVPAGDTLAYQVNFGDGSLPQTVTADASGGASFTHVYTTPGNHTLSVRTEDSSATPSPTFSTPVSNVIQVHATVANLNVSPASGSVAPGVAFTATLDARRSTARLNTTLSYVFSCGVGGPAPVLVSPAVATCTFTTTGTYAVGVTVTDSGMPAASSTVQKNVVVSQPAPPNLSSFTAAAGTNPLTAVADFSHVTVDKAANPANVTYTLNWGDGQTISYTGATLPSSPPVHSYAKPNTYPIQLTVDDGLGVATSVQTATVVVVVVAAPPQTGPTPVWRIAGADRFETGVKVSQFHWAAATDSTAPAAKHPDAVVLATGVMFPDALAGAPFAFSKNADLLLTDTTLNLSVENEIKRVLPADKSHTVYILGGYNAVSKDIETHIASLGYNVQRIGGVDRFDTALKIAHAMGDPQHIVVARGDDGTNFNGFADALSAGPFAADLFGTVSGTTYTPAAIVLTDNEAMTAATSSYIHSKLGSTVNVVAVGGPAERAMLKVPGIVVSGPMHNVEGLAGVDRYDTSKLVAQFFAPSARIGVATGEKFADALTGGAYQASIGGPLLLTDPLVLQNSTGHAVQAVAATTPEVAVFGGPNAISAKVYNSFVAAVHGVAKLF